MCRPRRPPVCIRPSSGSVEGRFLQRLRPRSRRHSLRRCSGSAATPLSTKRASMSSHSKSSPVYRDRCFEAGLDAAVALVGAVAEAHDPTAAVAEVGCGLLDGLTGQC